MTTPADSFPTLEFADRIQPKHLKTSDGVELYYEVLGDGERTLLLANGLGGRLYSWKPLLEAVLPDYRVIIWDYRGLFGSACQGPCRLSVREHAQDALAILDQENVKKPVWIGWSMGVQVTLEAASLAPDRVAGLILLNGTYGQVFSSALQPSIPIPILPRHMHDILELVRNNQTLTDILSVLGRQSSQATVGLFWLLMGKRAKTMQPMLDQYMNDIYQPQNFANFLRLAQELDAHSAYHHLPELDMPALVVSGRFDILTPAYQSREMARRLPQAEHLHVKMGSHFVLLEKPEIVVPRILSFLTQRANW